MSKLSRKQSLELRNTIFLEHGLPALEMNGFRRSPFKASWFGRDDLRGYSYELCRVRAGSILEIVTVYIMYDESPLESLYSFGEIHKMLQLEGRCTANWRGYKGTWEVIKGELFITSLVKDACSKNPPLVDPVLFFGEKSYPVKATWFSETINVRLSKNTWLYCGESKAVDESIGYEYEAMVYEFSSGDLVKKSKQKVEKIWEYSSNKCRESGF